MHIFGRADIEATGGIRRHQHFWLPGDLTGQDQALDIAAGQFAGLCFQVGSFDAIVCDQLFAMGANRFFAQQRAPGERLFRMVFE